MKRFILIAILSLLFSTQLSATHIIGGEMQYEYIGPGSTPNTNKYRIRLILFRGPTGATLINSYVVAIYNNDNNSKVMGNAENNNWTALHDFASPAPVPISIDPCITLAPVLNYTYKTYSFIVDLPNNNNGYTVAFQTYSRQNSLNVHNDQGANYYAVIPGSNQLLIGETDNSPKFGLPINVICNNAPFELDFSAEDIDGDSLVYSLCNALNGGNATLADYRNTGPPPYNPVSYVAPYTGVQPLGIGASINPRTGVISGTAPGPGKYVVCVCVDVYRNGRLIGKHRKDLIVEVSGCVVTQAIPNPGYTTCDGFNIQFHHNSTNAMNVFWDFGDESTLADTSRDDAPTYVYTDTGRYTVKFVINRGEACSDSTEIVMGVYPGFFPGFEVDAPYCTGVPIQFRDTTFTQYGYVDTWQWDFGDPTSTNNISLDKEPEHIYQNPGTYNIRLIVTNSKGCVDTVYKQITILPSPVLNLLSSDTTYCGLDTLQLSATGTGNFSWAPNNFIIQGNTATPSVFPNTPTTYVVTLESQGCISQDSVRLTPVFDLSNAIAASPAQICQLDTTTLTGSTNKTDVRWLWSGPAGTIESPTNVNTRVFPMSTANYTLTTYWGENCQTSSNFEVQVKPLANTNAGIDTSYCIGGPGVMLQATGGDTYRWTPSTGLSATDIPNPIASPATTTTYIVHASVTGCNRTVADTIQVFARPKPALDLTRDTLICVIDTVTIRIDGQGTFEWSPNYMISSTTASNPLFSPDVSTMYYVKMTDVYGCFKEDSVMINVRPDVTVDAGADTTICLGDSFVIPTTGDAVSYEWDITPDISDPTAKNPTVQPTTNTLYTVRANIGKCEKQSDIFVKVVPYPQPVVSADTSICIGFNTVIRASGGSFYQWTPDTYLQSPNQAQTQVIQPTSTTRYVVEVRDTLGCPKPVYDTVIVFVRPLPNVSIGFSDTTLVRGQSIRLSASGAQTYQWSPSTGLSATNVASPVASVNTDITYIVKGTSNFGCIAYDTVSLKFYDVYPGMYVPNAFTPNGDGLNDVARPILLGMKELKSFRIYNRYGQLVFETNQVGKGWDGTVDGKLQDMGTYVWYAEGLTFTGQERKQKGTIILIR